MNKKTPKKTTITCPKIIIIKKQQKTNPKQKTTWQFFSCVRQIEWAQQKVWLGPETREPEKGRMKWDLHIENHFDFSRDFTPSLLRVQSCKCCSNFWLLQKEPQIALVSHFTKAPTFLLQSIYINTAISCSCIISSSKQTTSLISTKGSSSEVWQMKNYAQWGFSACIMKLRPSLHK